jgi:DNA replication protein DnaC
MIELDAYDRAEIRTTGEEWNTQHTPARFDQATATHPDLQAWVAQLSDSALTTRRTGYPVVRTGPSTLVLGPVGTGKTHQAYGALRDLALSGVICKWRAITEATLLRRMRPRADSNAATEFDTLVDAHVLLLDDLGTEKRSEWNEAILLDLINTRYEHIRPTIITSNVKQRDFTDTFGPRITSRLAEMAQIITLVGDDRRRQS